VNVFVTGALLLLDPSLRTLAIVGFLEIAFVLALAMRRSEQPHSADDAHLPADTHGQAPAPIPGAAAASHH
jgi:NADH-quinone oxidoreductase subunit H